MGSTLVSSGKKGSVDYQIFNIDNVYTVYIKTDVFSEAENSAKREIKPVYSAVKSFETLKEAKVYIEALSKKK